MTAIAIERDSIHDAAITDFDDEAGSVIAMSKWIASRASRIDIVGPTSGTPRLSLAVGAFPCAVRRHRPTGGGHGRRSR